MINDQLYLQGFRRVSDPNGAVVPNTDIHLPYGTLINSCLYAVHYDPDYWPDPYEFKPERFLPENKKDIVNCSFMTFGAGPRMCPGVRFAFVNIKHTLIEILRKYNIKTCPSTPNEVHFKQGLMLANARDIVLKFEKRN